MIEKIFTIKNKLAVKIDKFLPSPFFYLWTTFKMSDLEISLFEKYLKRSKYYLEFGFGGSTIHALSKSNALIYTVENNLLWIKDMREYRYIRSMENKRLFIIYIDIGEVKAWGYPINNANQYRYPEYSYNIFQVVNCANIDTVLIDGRFRVACALNTILNCKNENLQLLIHDFSFRSRYHALLNFLLEIDRADSLSVFKVKNNIDLESVKNKYDIYKYNPE